MAGMIQAIRKEAAAKKVNIQTHQQQKVYDTLNELYRLPPAEGPEIEFESNLFTRGTGQDRSGLHTSAIIAGDKHYCVREQVLSLLYKPRDMNKHFELSTLRIFEEGNYIHRKWQRLFLRGELCEPINLDQTQNNEYYMLSFSPDAFIWIGGKKCIVEIKSMNEHIYKRTLNHSSAENQLLMYMFLSNTRHGIVLMENKNTQEFKVTLHDLVKEEERIAPFIQRLEDVRGCYESKTMPEKREDCKTKLSRRCLDCPMSDACWATPKERQAMRLA